MKSQGFSEISEISKVMTSRLKAKRVLTHFTSVRCSRRSKSNVGHPGAINNTSVIKMESSKLTVHVHCY